MIGCFRPLTASDVVVGQYEGYRGTADVPIDSWTETYVAARMWIDNERWKGVPFLLRTGKCLVESRQRVSVVFKDAVPGLPGQPGGGSILGFELSGDGEIELGLVIKRPGPEMTLGVGTTVLALGSAKGGTSLPAYSLLLHDVMTGDRSLFTRPDGLEHVWEVADGLVQNKPEPVPYARGTWGPPEARGVGTPAHLGPGGVNSSGCLVDDHSGGSSFRRSGSAGARVSRPRAARKRAFKRYERSAPPRPRCHPGLQPPHACHQSTNHRDGRLRLATWRWPGTPIAPSHRRCCFHDAPPNRR